MGSRPTTFAAQPLKAQRFTCLTLHSLTYTSKPAHRPGKQSLKQYLQPGPIIETSLPGRNESQKKTQNNRQETLILGFLALSLIIQ